MPVTIGSTPDAGFDEPLRLLADCHRRIEMFLAVLSRLATGAEAPLTALQREAVERAVTYFDQAAPRHTEDEERSLFPRMRASADAKPRAALAELDALEADHHAAAASHAEVDRLCRSWLRFGSLDRASADALRALLAQLGALYAHHIDIEERVVFAAAAAMLDEHAIRQIGREMADRRAVAWE
jgi:hemerythrin-like domain-containing protein